MKRWMGMLMLGLLITGCGQLARESEFWDHSSMYKDWGHLYFSWGGYKNCDASVARESNREGWWGITMPCGAATTAAAKEQAVSQAQDPKKDKLAAKKTKDKKKKKKKSRKSKSKKTTG